MLGKFLKEERATSALEYVIVATLAVALLVGAVWGIMNAVAERGSQTQSSLESQIPTPPP